MAQEADDARTTARQAYAAASEEFPDAGSTCVACANKARAVRFGDVLTYKESTAGAVVGDQLTGDHMPSYAAMRTFMEGKLGRSLTREEAAAVKNATNVVVIPHDLHAAGRTYKGSNSATRVAEDAGNPLAASLLDQQAHLENAPDLGHDPQVLAAAFQVLNQRNTALMASLQTKADVRRYLKGLMSG